MTPACPSANSLSTEDFDATSWHDNAIHGLRFETGDPDRGDWRSELVLDIDHIVEWVCGIDANVLFRVAPATLTFHDVTDCRVAIVQGDSGYQVGLQTLSIDRIERERISNQRICLDRPYYRWRILLNVRSGGEIAFGASGFSQELRAEPIISREQQLRQR